MIEVLVWLLIVQSSGIRNAELLERFPDQTQCEHVRNSLKYPADGRCIQTRIIVRRGDAK